MNIIFQDRFPVRTIVLIGVALLITTQIYAQNADARLSLTLRNATLKEFVKRIENSTGYSFIYSEEITIKHKINLQVKDKPLREILDLAFKNEQISYQFTGRHILLQKKKESKTAAGIFCCPAAVVLNNGCPAKWHPSFPFIQIYFAYAENCRLFTSAVWLLPFPEASPHCA